ncbi:MAG TPA: PilZ domain-containing protein [Myxococcota bacterium]|nr:PilZ domain-containing protein [Myxococcota bacterium]
MPDKARRLHLVFENPDTFRAEYGRNLAKGGAFVPTRERFALREIVEVRLEAPFAGEKLTLRAEVVHCLTRDAVAPGVSPGVAVQFLDPTPELRARLEAILEHTLEPSEAIEAPGDSALDFPGSDELDDPGIEGFEPTGQGESHDGDPSDRTHRTRAERARARVPVRVQGPTGKALQGRTRDLSKTGILLSVDGEELPVGREITVGIMHPTSGDVMEVSGKVVRHVAGEGVVPAVAVEIQAGPKAEAVARFVEEVRKVNEEQSRGGIRGPLEELGAVSLLQMFAALAKRGTLTVTCGVEEGTVAFEEGMLLLAQVGSVTGVKALARIFSWREGHFEFRAHVDPMPPAATPEPMEGSILDALRIIDEANRLSGPQLAPGARFAVHREKLGSLDRPLGKTEEAVLELAAAGFTVRRILDVIPENDAQIRSSLSSLVERGLLSPS